MDSMIYVIYEERSHYDDYSKTNLFAVSSCECAEKVCEYLNTYQSLFLKFRKTILDDWSDTYGKNHPLSLEVYPKSEEIKHPTIHPSLKGLSKKYKSTLPEYARYISSLKDYENKKTEQDILIREIDQKNFKITQLWNIEKNMCQNFFVQSNFDDFRNQEDVNKIFSSSVTSKIQKELISIQDNKYGNSEFDYSELELL